MLIKNITASSQKLCDKKTAPCCLCRFDETRSLMEFLALHFDCIDFDVLKCCQKVFGF